MILNSSFESNVGPVEFVSGTTGENFYEAALEDYIELEEAFGEMQVQQAVDEYRIMNELSMDGLKDSFMDKKQKAQAFISTYIEKAKEFFKKIWEHIKNFWRKVTAKISSWFLGSERFYTKYSKQIAAGAPLVKMNDYKYGDPHALVDKVVGVSMSISTRMVEPAELVDELVEKTANDVRKLICGSPESSDFKENLINTYRSKTKVDITEKDVDLTLLMNASNINKAIASAAKLSDQYMNAVLNNIDAVGKQFGLDQKQIAIIVKTNKAVAQVFQQAIGVAASLMSAKLAQAKSFAVEAVRLSKGLSTKDMVNDVRGVAAEKYNSAKTSVSNKYHDVKDKISGKFKKVTGHFGENGEIMSVLVPLSESDMDPDAIRLYADLSDYETPDYSNVEESFESEADWNNYLYENGIDPIQ